MHRTSRWSRLRAAAFILPFLLAIPAWAAVDQWSQIGPFGGRVTAVVFHPGNAQIAYAATDGNGVFRSTDGGGTWTPANIGLTRRLVTSLAIAPGSPATLYAGDGPLFRSTNGGASWTELPLGGVAMDVAVSPARPRTVVAVTGDRRIRQSDDAGATWRDLSSPAPLYIPDFLALDPRTPDTLYVGVAGYASPQGRGLYRSTDAGASWRRLETGLHIHGDALFLSYALAIAPDRPDTLYASIVSDETPSESALARSTDAGATWTLLGDTDDPGGQPVLALPGGRVVTDRAVSTDYGATWLPHAPPTMAVTALAAHPSRPQNVLLGAEHRGIFRSADGGSSWSPSSQGMTATRIEALAVGSDSTLYASALGDGLFASGNGGATWERLETPTWSADDFTWVKRLAVHPRRPRLLYAGINSYGTEILTRTDNGGASWTDLGPLPGGQSIAALALDPSAPAAVFAGSWEDAPDGSCRSFKSTDRGATWRCLELGQAVDLEVDPVDPRNVYGLDARVSKSTDRGATWTLEGYNRGLPPASNLYVLVHAPSASGHLYLTTDQGKVFRTTDGGRNWKDVTGNLPRFLYKSLAVDPRNPNVVYAAMSGVGVYRSKDGGRRWQLLNRGLSGGLLNGFFGRPTPLAVDPRDPSTVYVGTNSRGVFAITLTR